MTHYKAPIQYHARDYIGDARALAILQWLNARPQKKQKADPVEQLIRVNAHEWKQGADVNAVTRKVRAILGSARLRLAPYWFVPVIHTMRLVERGGRGRIQPVPMTDFSRWGIDWDPVAKGMGRAQALALRSTLELASDGLLGKVRECKREACGIWFFAAKSHQKFHSPECQQLALRSTDEWRDRHAAVMRRRRAAKREAAEAARETRHSKREGRR
jgi:hypothetical protein